MFLPKTQNTFVKKLKRFSEKLRFLTTLGLLFSLRRYHAYQIVSIVW